MSLQPSLKACLSQQRITRARAFLEEQPHDEDLSSVAGDDDSTLAGHDGSSLAAAASAAPTQAVVEIDGTPGTEQAAKAAGSPEAE
jgi:hypothetical protein